MATGQAKRQARTAQWLTLGLTAVIVTLAGCSNANSPTASQGAASSSQSASETEKPASESQARVVENVQLQPSSDPMAMVLTTRQPNAEPVGSEQIRLNYPNPDKAVVTVIKSGLTDDSVAATRTRYEFTPVAGAAEGAKQWQLAQVTEQNKCQPNRGSEDWTGDLCQ